MTQAQCRAHRTRGSCARLVGGSPGSPPNPPRAREQRWHAWCPLCASTATFGSLFVGRYTQVSVTGLVNPFGFDAVQWKIWFVTGWKISRVMSVSVRVGFTPVQFGFGQPAAAPDTVVAAGCRSLISGLSPVVGRPAGHHGESYGQLRLRSRRSARHVSRPRPPKRESLPLTPSRASRRSRPGPPRSTSERRPPRIQSAPKPP